MSADPFIGVDLRLSNGDLVVPSSGDLDLVGQTNPLDNILQAIALRLNTPLGSYYFDPEYGSNLLQYVDEPITNELTNQIIAEAQACILLDPRISSVTNLSVTQGGSGQILLSFTVVTVSGTAGSTTVPIGGV